MFFAFYDFEAGAFKMYNSILLCLIMLWMACVLQSFCILLMLFPTSVAEHDLPTSKAAYLNNIHTRCRFDNARTIFHIVYSSKILHSFPNRNEGIKTKLLHCFAFPFQTHKCL